MRHLKYQEFLWEFGGLLQYEPFAHYMERVESGMDVGFSGGGEVPGNRRSLG